MVKDIDQLLYTPVYPVFHESTIRRVQTPLGLMAGLSVLKAANGRYVPVKEPVPVVILCAAASENTVFTKFAVAPPLCIAKGTTVPAA
jgi:hypothetical protein